MTRRDKEKSDDGEIDTPFLESDVKCCAMCDSGARAVAGGMYRQITAKCEVASLCEVKADNKERIRKRESDTPIS